MDFNLTIAKKKLSNAALLFDIRTEKEFSQKHICGATLIPTPLPPLDPHQKKMLEAKLRIIVKHVPHYWPIILYCKKGIRAKLAKEILYKMGYYHTILLGGIEIPPLSHTKEIKFCHE